MAQYPKITLTNSGLNMIAESQGGTELIFTKMIMGDGELASGEDIKVLTGVKNAMLTVPLQGFLNQGEGQVRLRFTVSNETLDTGFFAREIGVYAKLGESGTEQLYAYTNAGNKTDYMPDKSVPLDSQILDLYIIVGNATGVSAVLDGNASYATKLDLTEHNTSETAHEDIRTAITEATKKAGLPVGFEYTIPYTELQAGQIPLLGGKYLKSTYTDLWAWVQTHPSLLKTEAQWQAMKTASGGRAVPFYADVDDTHFRVPLNTVWERGASSLNEIGTYFDDAIRNIVASTRIPSGIDTISGAFYQSAGNVITTSGSIASQSQLNFDASRVVPTAEENRPKTIARLWVVQAFGTNSNTGNMDVAQVAQAVTDVTARVSVLENDIGFTIIDETSVPALASITVKSRYVIDNPFPGYEVMNRIEVKINNVWYELTKVESTTNYYGAIATQLNDELILLTAEVALVYTNMYLQGMALPPNSISSNITTAPCRIKVWKIGRVTS